MSRIEPRRRRLGHLEAVEVFASEDAPYVVLFHGFGADCHDLVSLAQVISLGRPVNWLFPNGHISVPLGGHFEGRAWFPLRLAELQESIDSGKGVDFSSMTPPGLKRARGMVMEMLEKLGVPFERIVLGGFSQGAMLATDVTLNAMSAPAGLAILSGTLVNAEAWKELAPSCKGLRFFQSHGQYDAVLPVDAAVRLEWLLQEAGWNGKLVKFAGQHEIPPEILIQLGTFLRNVLPR